MNLRFYIIIGAFLFFMDINAQFREWERVKPIIYNCPVYIVDSLPGNIPLELLYSVKTGHMYAVDRGVNMKSIKENKIWSSNTSYLFMPDFFENLSFYIDKKNILAYLDGIKFWPLSSKYPRINNSNHNKNFNICTYNHIPEYYIKILIRGDFYNLISFGTAMEAYHSEVKFPDNFAFYPLLIPVFSDRSNEGVPNSTTKTTDIR